MFYPGLINGWRRLMDKTEKAIYYILMVLIGMTLGVQLYMWGLR